MCLCQLYDTLPIIFHNEDFVVNTVRMGLQNSLSNLTDVFEQEMELYSKLVWWSLTECFKLYL